MSLGDLLTQGRTETRIHPEIRTLADEFPLSAVPDPDRWLFAPGTSRLVERAPYWSYLDDGDAFPTRQNEPTTLLRLVCTPTGSRQSNSRWNTHSNYLAVRYGTDWDPEFDRDAGSETSRNEKGHDADAPKYMIGGPLCDPVVTGDIETAVDGIRSQLPRIEAGTRLDHLVEVITANGSTRGFERDHDRLALPDADELPDDVFGEDVETTSPLYAISGLGKRTVERFGSRFAVYPNLLTADSTAFADVLPGYHHSPDLDAVDVLVERIVEHYRKLSESADWSGPVIEPERFSEYPLGNPSEHRGI